MTGRQTDKPTLNALRKRELEIYSKDYGNVSYQSPEQGFSLVNHVRPTKSGSDITQHTDKRVHREVTLPKKLRV